MINFTFIGNFLNRPVLQNALRQVCLKRWSHLHNDWYIGLSSHKSICTASSINLSLFFYLGWSADECELFKLEYEAWIRFCAFPFHNSECILALKISFLDQVGSSKYWADIKIGGAVDETSFTCGHTLFDVGDDWLKVLGYVFVAAIHHCVHFVFEWLNKSEY